jgi:hypothetical protein
VPNRKLSSPSAIAGPAVSEAAWARVCEINREIAKLQREKAECVARMHAYANSTMLESERVATNAEVFQTARIPEQETK